MPSNATVATRWTMRTPAATVRVADGRIARKNISGTKGRHGR
jgi:hypothetical protein